AVVGNGREEKKKEVPSTIHEGGGLGGRVARLTDFGAFVDLGGSDGLVHVSESSHSHVAKPSDVLVVNDDVNVKVLSINP
ncbi:S1 RNA-binding domain-containing protein, partial [Enterococcus faecium]